MVNALREWRAEKGLGLSWLADRLGVRVSTVSRWESGASPADADVIDRIEALTQGAVTAADLYAIRLTWLRENRRNRFGSVESPKPHEVAE